MLSAKEVAEFLLTHPNFMDENPEVFVNLEVPHPKSEGMIPLSVRQIEILRQHNERIMADYKVLHENVVHNINMLKTMQHFCVFLMSQKDQNKPIKLILKALKVCYPELDPKIRVWGLKQSQEALYQTTDTSLRAYARTLEQPTCGSQPLINKWYRKKPASLVVLPLRFDKKVFGLLSFGSSNPETFEEGTEDTELLSILGQFISAYLSKWV